MDGRRIYTFVLISIGTVFYSGRVFFNVTEREREGGRARERASFSQPNRRQYLSFQSSRSPQAYMASFAFFLLLLRGLPFGTAYWILTFSTIKIFCELMSRWLHFISRSLSSVFSAYPESLRFVIGCQLEILIFVSYLRHHWAMNKSQPLLEYVESLQYCK